MASDVMTAASGRWRDILEVLGGLQAEQLSNRHQPCPMCAGTDRYRFDDKDGSGVQSALAIALEPLAQVSTTCCGNRRAAASAVLSPSTTSIGALGRSSRFGSP